MVRAFMPGFICCTMAGPRAASDSERGAGPAGAHLEHLECAHTTQVTATQLTGGHTDAAEPRERGTAERRRRAASRTRACAAMLYSKPKTDTGEPQHIPHTPPPR
jgi:hypothetical protein